MGAFIAMQSIQIPGYEMLRSLGTGGMSEVYLARQISLDRKVAIKVMKRVGDASGVDAQQFEKRFLLEGRTMALLPHRNIVAVYDIVTTDQIAYIVMEYLDGGTLSERISGGMSLAEVLSVVIQTATALEFAHGRGIVHRDLKSSNIMFRDHSVPVLTDFGIARQQDSSTTALTQAGMMVGTPQYMSPEQINGLAVDGRADQYSLGVLFYELLSGTHPFTGDTALSVLMAHLTKDPPPLPVEFRAFQDIVSRMLSKDREQRYPDLNAFISDVKLHLTQSNTLLTRLHLNPDQSAADQLRDIGFNSTPSGLSFTNVANSATTGMGRARIDRLATTRLSRLRQRPAFALAIGGAVVAIAAGCAWYALTHKRALTQDQEDLISYRIERAASRIKAGQLVVPSEGSAFEDLQRVLQLDNDNKHANEMLGEIAHSLAATAEKALSAGQLEQALEASDEGLLVRPDDAQIKALRSQIAQAQVAARTQKQVADLLRNAETARLQGRIFGDKSAYDLLNQAMALQPANNDVKSRLDALIATELAAPQNALDANQLSVAAALLVKLEPYLEKQPAFIALNARLSGATKKVQVDQQVAALLARANVQLRAGHWVAPGNDNASESLNEMRKISPDDKRVGDFAHAFGQAALTEAKRQEAANEPNAAINNAELALQVDPQATDAQQFKAQIEQRVGERVAQIAQSLSAIRQAMNEQRFVAPSSNDAHTALEALLKLDPDNKDAKQLLADLPKSIAMAAQARINSDAQTADALVASALRVYPQDVALAQLQARLKTQLAADTAARAQRAQREKLVSVLAAAAPSTEQLSDASIALNALLADNDTSAETRNLRVRLLAAIAAHVRNAADTAELASSTALLDAQKKLFGADAAYTALIAALPELRTKVAAADQARLDAARGDLVLNAFPWGKVDAVVGADDKSIALPRDTVTPLTVRVPAGTYRITFSHPQTGKPIQVIAKVQAQQRAEANAAFPTISAKGYFTRAGW